MAETLVDASAEPFRIYVIQYDGTRCFQCDRVIRVREKCGAYSPKVTRKENGESEATGHTRFRCRECLYAEPINEHNRTWRKDA